MSQLCFTNCGMVQARACGMYCVLRHKPFLFVLQLHMPESTVARPSKDVGAGETVEGTDISIDDSGKPFSRASSKPIPTRGGAAAESSDESALQHLEPVSKSASGRYKTWKRS